MAVSGNQLKAARILAGMDQEELAQESGVSINTIRKMEASGAQPVRVRLETMDRIKAEFKFQDIEFIGEDDGRLGVQFTTPRSGFGVAAIRAKGKTKNFPPE